MPDTRRRWQSRLACKMPRRHADRKTASFALAQFLRHPSEPMNSRFLKLYALVAALVALSGCSTVTEMVEANMPNRHSGRPSIAVSLRAQEAYLYRGSHRVASSRISSGREGYRTPVGHFRVTRKDIDHRSSLYGDYADASGKIVRANVDSRRDRKPPATFALRRRSDALVSRTSLSRLRIAPGVPAGRACLTWMHQVALLESAAVL